MYFLATGRILRPEETAAHVPEEVREFDRLRAEGFIQEVFFLRPGPGVVNVVEAASREDAEAKLAQLPFASLGLMEFELAEVTRH
ncbi:hypothetical protein AB0383_17720 [Amycolatopsis sp. NPDC051373]|uniref:hypothetical protein n=1 Tax=Amycolatopsis sp. NPDC051373 TaxID=3155801 RepID=UPI00344D99E5